MSYFEPVNRLPGTPVFLTLVALLALAGPLEATALDLGGGDFAASYQRVQSLTERTEGSNAEAQLFADLERRFAPKTTLHITDFQQLQDFHSFSRSLWFRTPGKQPGELVIVVPTDSESGRSNNAGVAWAEIWAERALSTTPQVSLTFFFTGAQRGAGALAARGTLPFLRDFSPQTPAAALVLDLDNTDHPVDLTTGSGTFPSPIWLSQILLEALESRGFLPEIQGTQPQIFRFDLPERRNLLQPWFDRGIPALLLTSSVTRTDKALAREVHDLPAAIDLALAGLKGGIPGYWDKHYLYFHLGNLKFFLSQQTYLLGLLLSLGVLLMAFLLFSRTLRADLNGLLRGLWQFPVLFSFLFLFLYAGTLWSTFLVQERDFPEFWKYSPLVVLLLKVSVAIGLYFAVFLQFRRLPLSRSPDFYSFAAVLVLALSVISSAALELSFSFYFLWALIFAGLFHAVPWRPLKLLIFLLAPVWFVKSFLEIFWLAPDPELIRIALVSTFAGNLLLAAVLFPFLLLVNSYHFTRHQRQDRNEKHRSRFSLGISIATWVGLSLLLLRSDPFTDSAAPLTRLESLDLALNTRSVEDIAPFPLPSTSTSTLPFLNSVWTTTVSRAGFLDRLVWTIQFQGFEKPESVALTLVGNQNLVLYDANFPYTIDATGTKVTILVGRTPPATFALKLTLGAKIRAQLGVKAVFQGTPQREWYLGRWFNTTKVIQVHDVRDLKP